MLCVLRGGRQKAMVGSGDLLTRTQKVEREREKERGRERKREKEREGGEREEPHTTHGASLPLPPLLCLRVEPYSAAVLLLAAFFYLRGGRVRCVLMAFGSLLVATCVTWYNEHCKPGGGLVISIREVLL